MGEVFVSIYYIIMIIVAMLFLLMVFLGIMDYIRFLLKEGSQRRTAKYNAIFNKDTTDMYALKYARYNGGSEDEPYNVYLVQSLATTLVTIFGILFILIGLQIGLFLGFKVYAVITQRYFVDKFALPLELMMLIGFFIMVIFAVKMLYSQIFVDETFASIRNTKSKLQDTRDFIYANLSDNNVFLDALRAENLGGILDAFNSVLHSPGRNPSNCENSTAPCDRDAERMMFSLNLYSFFRTQVPSEDPNYDHIRLLFDVAGVKNQMVDPMDYFYYNREVYVTDLYPNLRDRMSQYFGSGQRENIFSQNVSNRTQELNDKLKSMYLRAAKKDLGKYLGIYMAIMLVFTVLLTVLMHKQLNPYLHALKERVMVVFRMIARVAMMVMGRFARGGVV